LQYLTTFHSFFFHRLHPLQQLENQLAYLSPLFGFLFIRADSALLRPSRVRD
jgi:hypothetical protein